MFFADRSEQIRIFQQVKRCQRQRLCAEHYAAQPFFGAGSLTEGLAVTRGGQATLMRSSSFPLRACAPLYLNRSEAISATPALMTSVPYIACMGRIG